MSGCEIKQAARAYGRALRRAAFIALCLAAWLALAVATGPIIAERASYLVNAFTQE